MEGIQTINALKAVQSSLPAQTTIPSDELVMLYAADGTPIAKIARDDLVKAVASVMASNSQTTFSKLLGVQANGTPLGIGPSDLASVLGDASLPDYTTPSIAKGVAYNSDWEAVPGLWKIIPSSYSRINASMVFVVNDDKTINILSTPWFNVAITVDSNKKFVITQNFNSGNASLSLTKLG